MGVKVIGSHVRTNKKLPATQAFCLEKWLAADCYNHLCFKVRISMFYHDQWLNFNGFKLLYEYHNSDQFNHENYKYNKTKLVVNSKYLVFN